MTTLNTPTDNITNAPANSALKADQVQVGAGGVVDFSGNPLGTLSKQAAITITDVTATNAGPYTIRTDTIAHCAADAQAAINALCVDVAAVIAAYETDLDAIKAALAAANVTA